MPLLDINQYVADRNGNNNAYQFFLEVIQNSQSVPNNTTNITVNHYALGRNGWGFSGFTTPASYITVGGELKKTTTVASIPTSGAKTLIGTWTGNVDHLGDGTLSLSVSARFAPNTTAYGYVPKENTLSGTVQPTTIPRASDISVSNYTISNTTGSISYSITSKADFYHIIAWELNGTTNTSGATRINNTTQSFTISNQTLLNALPTQVSGSLNITVTTYSNSACTNLVGSKTASATITINTASIKPSCTLGNIAINYTPHNSITVPVAGYSKVQSSFTATPGYGASGTITYFSASHGDLATASSNSASGSVVSNTIPSNTSNYTYTLSAYAKDSRGAVGTTVTKTITVYGYQSPSATLNAYRTATNAAADTTLDGAGGYVYVTFSGAVRSSINSQNAIVSTSCTYSGGISGTATTGSHYTLGIDKNVTFTLTVTDRVSSSTAVVSVSTVTYPLDLYDNGTGTVGIGLGTIANSGYVTIGQTLHTRGNWFTINNLMASNLNQTSEGVVAYNTSTTNRPCDYGVCYTLGQAGNTNSSSWYSQIAFGTNGITYFRNSINSQGTTWGMWYPIYAGNNKPTASDVGALPISSSNTADGEYKFLNSSYAPTITDTAPGIGCANKGSRYLVNELLTDGIIAPPTAYSQHSMSTAASTIRFYKYTGYSGGQWTGLTKTAIIDTDGTYKPQIAITNNYYLAGLAGVANSATEMRIQVPIPSGYTTVTPSIVSNANTANLGYYGASGWQTITMTAVSVLDKNPASVTLTITTSGLTAYRNYTFRNGYISIKLS